MQLILMEEKLIFIYDKGYLTFPILLFDLIIKKDKVFL